jgi:hypothetical protein
MTPHQSLDACRAARVPAAGLAALASFRTTSRVQVVLGDPTWVTWDGPRPDLIVATLAVPAVELFELRDGRWFRIGERLPAFDVPPAGPAVPLDRAVGPAAVRVAKPPIRDLKQVALRLVPGDRPRPTAALRCSLAALAAWADSAPTAAVTAVRAARSGSLVWLLGSGLPALERAERFWGDRVLIPLGLRVEPDWAEAAIREAAAVGPDEILVLTWAGVEAISTGAFRPLARGAIRRALA